MDNKTFTNKLRKLAKMHFWDSSETHLVSLGYFNQWGGSRKAMTDEQASLYDECTAEFDSRFCDDVQCTPTQLRLWLD